MANFCYSRPGSANRYFLAGPGLIQAFKGIRGVAELPLESGGHVFHNLANMGCIL